MAAERSTKIQVQAYRFGVRRVEHAVQTGVAYRESLHGPRQGLAMTIGLVVAGLVLAGFAVYGFLKPAPSIGDASVLVDTDSGGAFVVRDGVLHPALNVASAMLAAGETNGTGGSIRQVNTATLGELPRGQLLGIPGAPSQVPVEGSLVTSTWTVCDVLAPDPAAAPGTRTPPRTTLVIGMPITPGADAAAVLVTPDGQTYYLLFDGRRSRVTDVHDRVIAEGLGLDPAAARRVSLALLNAIPEGPSIDIPRIAGAGRAVAVGTHKARVGDIVRVERASGGSTFVLVHADGVQDVPPAVADLMRAVTGQRPDVAVVSPADLAAAGATTTPVDISGYPAHRPRLADTATDPALCVDWQVQDQRVVRQIRPAAGLALPVGAVPVPAPPQRAADRDGTADAVYLPPGHGLVVGQASDGVTPNTGNLFLVTDQGISYPVVDLAALRSLGLGATVAPAPGELLTLLPLGPTLDPVAARRFFDEQPRGNG